MAEKPTVILTGASRGIGRAIAIQLSLNDKYKLCLLSRDLNGLNETKKLCQAIKPETFVKCFQCDVSIPTELQSILLDVCNNYGPLHVLINNAGVGAIEFKSHTKTVNGIEMQFGINHLGHFYLTQKLTDLLSKTSGISRVINVASLSAYVHAPRNMKEWLISEDKLNDPNEYDKYLNYGVSKACNVIYSREYNGRYGKGDSGIYSVSVHPGFVSTNITASSWKVHFVVIPLLKNLMPGLVKTVSQGAATTIRVAAMSDNEFVNNGGKYFSDCNHVNLWRNDLIEGGKESDELGELLWNLSTKIIKQKGFQI
eukprot:411482_1